MPTTAFLFGGPKLPSRIMRPPAGRWGLLRRDRLGHSIIACRGVTFARTPYDQFQRKHDPVPLVGERPGRSAQTTGSPPFLPIWYTCSRHPYAPAAGRAAFPMNTPRRGSHRLRCIGVERIALRYARLLTEKEPGSSRAAAVRHTSGASGSPRTSLRPWGDRCVGSLADCSSSVAHWRRRFS